MFGHLHELLAGGGAAVAVDTHGDSNGDGGSEDESPGDDEGHDRLCCRVSSKAEERGDGDEWREEG